MMPLIARLARRLVRLYPRAWRDRYVDELLDVLAARPPTWADVWDLAWNVAYSHLHPDLALGGDAPLTERLALLMRVLKSSEIMVFGAFVVAMIAWLQFGGLVDGGPYAPLVGAGDSWPLIAFDPRSALSVAMAAQSAAVDLAFLAMLSGGLPLVVTAWRSAPRVRRLFLVPVACLLGAFLPALIVLLTAGGRVRINLTFEAPITIAYCCWFLVLAGASVWALSRAIAQANVSDRLVRFAFVPCIVAGGALLLMLVATIWWGVAAHLGAPRLFDQPSLTLGYATLTTWSIDVAVMAAAALAAVLVLARGAASSRVPPAAA